MTEMTKEVGWGDTLRHIADDHPCCRVSLLAAVARIEELGKAICDELCECGSWEDTAKDEHDNDCPYFKFVATLAAHGPDVLSGEEET